MSRLKVMTVVGTRPEIIRLSACIKACDDCFEHLLVHTGQNWDDALSGVFFRELGIRAPDYTLRCASETLGQTMGAILSATYELFARERPDALLVLGDTNSALCAIGAKRLKIPIFHMEAGNRCFDFNVPEEINRRIVDHIADVNLPYTEHSRRYLLREGFEPSRIFVTGSPMREVLTQHRARIEQSDVLARLELPPGGFFLLSAHREENLDDERTFFSLMSAVNDLAASYGLPVVYSVHPRSAIAIERRGFALHPLVRALRPFGFFDYCRLQTQARCVLSDSGTLSEESAMLGFPAVLIRTSTERPEVLDKGTLVLGGTDSQSIMQAVSLACALPDRTPPAAPPDYQDGCVSGKVVRLIQSYTHIINQTVWHKTPPGPLALP